MYAHVEQRYLQNLNDLMIYHLEMFIFLSTYSFCFLQLCWILDIHTCILFPPNMCFLEKPCCYFCSQHFNSNYLHKSSTFWKIKTQIWKPSLSQTDSKKIEKVFSFLQSSFCKYAEWEWKHLLTLSHKQI